MQERIDRSKNHHNSKSITEKEAEEIRREDIKRQKAQERKSENDKISDELLDEIEGVLEENAEEFVASYIQKGGQ